MVIHYLKICWQIKYFLSKFYLEIIRWSLNNKMGWYGNSLVENLTFFCKIQICSIVVKFWTQPRELYNRYESKNSKIDRSYSFKTNIQDSTGCIQFNSIVINMRFQPRDIIPRYSTFSVGYNLLPQFFKKSP